MKAPYPILVALVALAPAGGAGAGGPQPENLAWRLDHTKVVERGASATIDEGTLLTGFVIEGKASSDGPLIKRGKVRITLSVFVPSNDMPGQRAGRAYVRGEWIISDPGALHASLKARHSPDVVRGFLDAELDFDPTAAQPDAPMRTRTTLPMSLAAGRWAAGTGSFTGNARFEGMLELVARLWPELQGR